MHGDPCRGNEAGMINGLLIINKEKGYTSFDVVAKLRSLLHQKKIGHLGTLDPEAEGVLPVCLGKAARLADRLSGGQKVYRAVLRLGITTDTQDACGRLLQRSDVCCTEEEVRRVAAGFTGLQEQLTPMYSARKVDGKKLVDLAREGRDVPRKTAQIEISRLDVLSVDLPYVTLRAVCSKGTYIRTLCHDIGEALGCGGMMDSLVREEACGYRLKDALTLEEVTALVLTEKLGDRILTMPDLLADCARFTVPEPLRIPARNGNPLPAEPSCFDRFPKPEEDVLVSDAEGNLLGLYRRRGRKLWPDIMLNQPEEEKPFVPRPSVVSLGKFDGLHCGHQAILAEMERIAKEKKLRRVLFSFTSAPEALIGGKTEICLLTKEEKRLLAKAKGIDLIEECPFTPEIRTMRAEDFLRKILIGRYGMRELVVGPDCCFGYGREGNVEYLKAHAEEWHYRVTVVEKVRLNGEIISSTRIKSLLAVGELTEAADCLGRAYSFRGRVLFGRQLGRELGYPTINLAIPEKKACPPFGVYAAVCESEGKTWLGMADLGTKPTVGSCERPGLEMHLFDSGEDLYGKTVTVSLLRFIRPEKCFGSTEELKEQLAADEDRIRQLSEQV